MPARTVLKRATGKMTRGQMMCAVGMLRRHLYQMRRRMHEGQALTYSTACQ